MTTWISFLKQKYEILSPGTYGVYISTYNWVETVVRDGILPALKAAGYMVSVDASTLSTCILNTLYRHEKDYMKSLATHYKCMHAHPEPTNENVTFADQIEYFHEILPTSVWKELHGQFPVVWFADGGFFAERIWMDMPHIVAWHIKFNDSPANKVLEDRLRHLDEEDMEEEESSNQPSHD
jgi:hypothetical protein